MRMLKLTDKINMSWDVMYCVVTINNTAFIYLKVAKSGSKNLSSQEKNVNCAVMYVKCIVVIKINSLNCIPGKVDFIVR